MASDQLAFLKTLAGSTSDKTVRDKQYSKLLHSVIPDCEFHYGWDMSLFNALDTVLKGSSQPVTVRDGRYMMVSGHSGPYLLGRGFMWIDMQDGIALGGFYFHPTNGEPTPSVNIFSRQVQEAALEMNQLPPAFAEDLKPLGRAKSRPAGYDELFHHGFQQEDCSGARRGLLRARQRVGRAS